MPPTPGKLADTPDTLEGKLLIAMPAMTDSRFERSVIFMCAHSADGALGLVINKPVNYMRLTDLLDQLSISPKPSGQPHETLDKPILFGGPVDVGRGFVLHSSDYLSSRSTLRVTDEISLTGTVDILKAIAARRGPDNCLFALGYAGWAPGQLEAEIRGNGWLHCEADQELLFQVSPDAKYISAMGKIGVDVSLLSGAAGHA